MSAPLPDMVDEARRVLAAAQERGVTLRLIGGLAVQLHAGPERPAAFAREFKDIDFATRSAESRAADTLFVDIGYEPSREFNALNAGRRAIYGDPANDRHVDLFFERFEMCHRIPIMDRVPAGQGTIPLAELLLTKLQIVEINEKDQRDVCALLYEHPVGESDEETINAGEIARLCAADWGLWRTCGLNLEKLPDAVDRYELPDAGQRVIRQRVDELWARIESEPKSRKWKLRDRIGDRRQWYLDPEEVGAG
jgi:hypothetical protein